MQQKPGDIVEVVAKDGVYEGTLMPGAKGFCIIKLSNGYNACIDEKKIVGIKVKKQHEQTPEQAMDVVETEGLPRISILHTGGTIASKVDYETGGVVARFTPEEILMMFPELGKIANIKSRLVSNMFSEDIRFAHYNVIAQEIAKEIAAGADGIIITHGTDTLHYTSAALTFMLQGLRTPVILVGAQRSSDRGSTDAALNLICAAMFIAQSDFAGVGVCMHETVSDDNCIILPGTKCRKMHSSRRDAFKPINSEPVARVDYSEKKICMLTQEYAQKGKSEIRIMPFKENVKVGILPGHPNLFASEVLAYEGFDGLVLEGTGLGHFPINLIDNYTKENDKILKAIGEIVKMGTVVVMSTQTIYGETDMNVYSTGRKLLDTGVIGNYCDMTPETAFIKLAWLLSNYTKSQARDLFEKNMMGEISARAKKI